MASGQNFFSVSLPVPFLSGQKAISVFLAVLSLLLIEAHLIVGIESSPRVSFSLPELFQVSLAVLFVLGQKTTVSVSFSVLSLYDSNMFLVSLAVRLTSGQNFFSVSLLMLFLSNQNSVSVSLAVLFFSGQKAVSISLVVRLVLFGGRLLSVVNLSLAL